MALPLVVLLETGVRGIDYGLHWDEQLQINLVGHTVRTGVLLPNTYNYPCMSYLLTLLSVTPYAITQADAIVHRRDLESIADHLEKDHASILRARHVFLFVSSLAVVWIFLLVLAWRGRPGEAFLAAAFYGLSWETAYHARWVAPDSVMTAFTALTMMFALLSRVRPDPRPYLRGMAVAAGLATATKYQCGLLLLPLGIAVAQSWRREDGWWALVRREAGAFGLFALTYSLVTPGMWLDTARFLNDFLFVTIHYSQGGHGGFDMHPGWQHLWKLLTYLGRDYFSHYPAASLAISGFVLVGIWSVARGPRATAILFFSFPVPFFAFMVTQRVLVVRNDLPLTPFLAVLAARGVTELMGRLPRLGARAAVAAALMGILVLNGVWLVRAAESIRTETPATALAELARFLEKHPERRVFASPDVRRGLAVAGYDVSRLAATRDEAKDVVLYPEDWLAGWMERPSNIPNVVERWFGPYEVNWSYYTSWWGFQRIVLMDRDGAERALHGN